MWSLVGDPDGRDHAVSGSWSASIWPNQGNLTAFSTGRGVCSLPKMHFFVLTQKILRGFVASLQIVGADPDWLVTDYQVLQHAL